MGHSLLPGSEVIAVDEDVQGECKEQSDGAPMNQDQETGRS